MKLFVAILFAVLAASANADEYDDIDWSKVLPVQDMPGWWDGREIKPASKAELASARIVGGSLASPHQFPYQVALITSFGASGSGLCGGSIIGAVSLHKACI